jgi:hypothetical protein
MTMPVDRLKAAGRSQITVSGMEQRSKYCRWSSSLNIPLKAHIDDWPFHGNRIVTEL